MQLHAGFGARQIIPIVVATRGSRLALGRTRHVGTDQGPEAFSIEVIHVIETDADDRMSALIVFDIEDIDASLAELETVISQGKLH